MTTEPIPLNRYFDHAILTSDTTEAHIKAACAEAREYNFFGLAVNPCWNELIAKELAGSAVTGIGVAGFPLGATTPLAKTTEATEAAQSGAGEVDMVANIGRIVAGDLRYAENEIAAIRRALPDTVALKVIIETPLLNDSQIRDTTKAVINAGAQFVKTATGFFGATTREALNTVVAANNNQIKVKASGGIKTLTQAEDFIALGAHRLGSSSSVAIMREYQSRKAPTTSKK